MMDESSIWAAALLDILDVVPRYRLHREIATMSPLELRRNALEISKLYHMWTKRVAPPKSVTRHPLPVDASRIDLLPGGAQLLILTSKGDLQLYDFPGTFELVASVARNDALDIVPADAQLRRAKSPPSNLWAAVASPFRTSPEREPDATEFRIFSITLDPSSLEITETFILDGVCTEICAAGDLLIAITDCSQQQSCVIRKIRFPAAKDGSGGSQVIPIDNDMINTRIAVVYPHILLMRCTSHLLIYGLDSIEDGDSPPVLASNRPGSTAGSITACLSRYQDAWVPTHYYQNVGSRVTEGIRFVSATGHAHDFDVPLDGPYALGESHTVTRVINFGAGGPVGFQCFASFIRHDNHVGYMRLGFREAPSPKHFTYIPLAGRTGFVREVGFDEETGRICAVFRPFNKKGLGPAEIIVANFR
ncbi:hypothetical protein HWV62_34663 [Athelia sp. TMB]|nr:hypothetical protein HWV62_34663 [Athelia sp. TMB]